MSVYHLAFVLLLGAAAWECSRDRTPKWLLWGLFGLLTAMLCLRYGQGSDYFSYGHIYYELPTNLFAAFGAKEIHGEWGWKLLCLTGRWLNMPYPAFILGISLAQMGFFRRFLRRFCEKPLLALLLGWHTLYLTYFFSILRQGLAIAIFLGVLLGWLEERKYLRYALGCLVCASFHSSALVLLALPLLRELRWKEIHLLVLSGLAWAGGAVLATGVLNGLFSRILPGAVANYLPSEGVSLGALGERLVTYGAILAAWWYRRREAPPDSRERLLFGVVTAGFALYGGLMWMPLVASRTAYLLKAAEIALLGNLLPKKGWPRWALFGFCAALAGLMHVKNIASFLDHAAYFEWVTVWNYPYVTVFRPENIRNFLVPPYDYLP